ncbi:MAG: response regulator [Pseudanabaena sp.]
MTTFTLNSNDYLFKSIITVLIVADAETDRVTYRHYLQSDQSHVYRFLEAATLKEGLALWRSQSPDIILVDDACPDGGDDLEILQAMKADNLMGRLGMIVITGRGNDDLLVQLMRLGVADYLVKSTLTDVDLCTCVGQVYDRIKITRQLRRSQDQEQLIDQISFKIQQYLDLDLEDWSLD